jgi:RNA polymerase sigma-70 factor (ECF subfamily)
LDSSELLIIDPRFHYWKQEIGSIMATVAIPAAKWSWESPYPQVRTSNSLDADVQLVERCLGGQEAAWEDLVRVHTRRVYSICYRFTNSDPEAQDLTQDVFLRVFKNLKSFRAGEGLFIVWLTRLTRNLLIDHYRRSRMDRATESIEDQISALEENTATMARTEGMLAGREASELLQAALQRLSPELRETVILRDLEELEYREIAQILNVPEGTVKSRLNRGRAELARVLRRQKIRI